MDLRAMEPFGRALLAYLDGDSGATVVCRRDDGQEVPIPAAVFFRGEPAFTELETTALRLCAGRVLDIGVGAGPQSLALQGRGLHVTGLDISPEAVVVARRRGVAEVRCADVSSFTGGPFDTLLMLGHGIGMVETIAGLERFLSHARSLVAGGGGLLVDSHDVRATDDPANLAYHEANRRAGRYVGEIRMQFEFRGQAGPYYGWLHGDAETLREHAEAAGWGCDIVLRGVGGDYLARLTRQDAV